LRWLADRQQCDDYLANVLLFQDLPATSKEMRVRYLLVALGLLALVVGLFSDWRVFNTVWLIGGAVFVGLGLATIDIVAAIKGQSQQRDYAEQLRLFQEAARRGDSQSMAKMLREGIVPEDLARNTADSILRDKDSPKL
jgi:hypothetical protein